MLIVNTATKNLDHDNHDDSGVVDDGDSDDEMGDCETDY